MKGTSNSQTEEHLLLIGMIVDCLLQIYVYAAVATVHTGIPKLAF